MIFTSCILFYTKSILILFHFPNLFDSNLSFNNHKSKTYYMLYAYILFISLKKYISHSPRYSISYLQIKYHVQLFKKVIIS